MAEYKYRLEVVTPILAGYSKKQFGFRIYARIDLSAFKIVDYNFSVTEQEIDEYIKKNKLDVNKVKIADIINAIIDQKSEEIDKQMQKNGLAKIDYLFLRKHYNIHEIKTIQDYINWIDYWSIFARPFTYMTKHVFDKKVSVEEIKLEKVRLNIVTHYFSLTQTPVYYESIGPGSVFIITTKEEIPLKDELVSQFGRAKSFGYGKVKITEA